MNTESVVYRLFASRDILSGIADWFWRFLEWGLDDRLVSLFLRLGIVLVFLAAWGIMLRSLRPQQGDQTTVAQVMAILISILTSFAIPVEPLMYSPMKPLLTTLSIVAVVLLPRIITNLLFSKRDKQRIARRLMYSFICVIVLLQLLVLLGG